MKETDFLEIINKRLTDNSYLGDDCAYLKEFDLYVTQDTLVEDVHFSLNTITPEQLGWKAVAVNLSDLAACAAEPLYITISLSLPGNIDDYFVDNFYKGVNRICEQYGVKVIGGDLTGSDKVFVSICAFGKRTSDFKISRAFAKAGDVVVVSGNHGESAAGLSVMTQDGFDDIKRKHLCPIPQVEKGMILGKYADRDFSMMDTSDGLADALYKIADMSDVRIEVDFSKIPYNKEIEQFINYKDFILWGGEDYELLATIPESVYHKVKGFSKIGKVLDGSGVCLVDGENFCEIDEKVFSSKSYKHFED